MAMNREVKKEIMKRDKRLWYEMCNVGWQQHYVRQKEGIRISYLTMGPKNGLPLVLQHGNIDCRLGWQHIAPVLANLGFCVVIPESRGNGLTDDGYNEELCYDAETLADDIIAVLDDLGIEKASFVGHSMGTFILQALAVAYPERVHSLSLISTAPKFALMHGYKWDGTDYMANEDYALDMGAADISEDFELSISKYALGYQTKALVSVRNMFAKFDYTEKNEKITCPVQIFYGPQDPLFTEKDEQAMIDSLKNAKKVEYIRMEGCEHSPHWQSWVNTRIICNKIIDFVWDAQHYGIGERDCAILSAISR